MMKFSVVQMSINGGVFVETIPKQCSNYGSDENHLLNRVVPFDVPGHKVDVEIRAYRILGIQCLKADVNSMKPLDNLCHPVSVIKGAEMLAAEAFKANTHSLL